MLKILCFKESKRRLSLLCFANKGDSHAVVLSEKHKIANFANDVVKIKSSNLFFLFSLQIVTTIALTYS